MGLNLIRRGPETVRLDVEQGTGWKPVRRGILDASDNEYPELATIQATGCTGLRVYDFDAPGQPFWESTSGTSHALTVIKTGRRLAVRAENTTDKTEVIMHVVPIPPPLCNCKVLALVGVVLNGFTQNRHQPRRGRVHPHRRFRLAQTGRAKPSLGNDWGCLCNSRTGHLPHRGAAKCHPVQPLTVDERGEYHTASRGGVPRGKATVLRIQRGTKNHPTVTVAGGERRGA